MTSQILKSAELETPLGPMIAMGDDTALYLLEFVSRKGLERQIKRLKNKVQSEIIQGHSASIASITEELKAYFAGQLDTFKTPFVLTGTPFQIQVWEELLRIPKGEKRSYLEIARLIGKPTAFRAVAQANGSNRLCIVVPCHRVINSNGKLGGYSAGLSRKNWLLDLERQKNEQ